MSYNSYLATALQTTADQIAFLNPYRSTDVHNYFFSLTDPLAREDYIKKTEIFVYKVRAIDGFIRDLLFFIECLEDIKKEHDKIVLDRPRFVREFPRLLGPVPTLARAFCDNMHGFIRMLQHDLKLLIETELSTDYPELKYIALLRNEFVHHPLGAPPTDSFLDGSVIESNSRTVPFSQIGPGGGGWAYMSTFYESSITDESFKTLTPEQQLIQNRSELLAAGGWKNAAVNPELKAHIKTYGLPRVDQAKAAIEFIKLSTDKIIPYLQFMVTQAKADKVLI